MTTLLDLYNETWNPMLQVLTKIERAGFAIDVDYFTTQADLAKTHHEQIEEELLEWTDGREVNWRSWQELQPWLYEDCKFPPSPIKGTLKAVKGAKRDRKTKEITEKSTAEAALYWLELNAAHETRHQKGLAALRRLRKTYRYWGYLQSIPAAVARDGRVHCVLAPEAETGRLSARYPPLQQIPSGDPYAIRAGFVAAPGNVLVVSDYSQLEIYIMAHWLIELFQDYTLAEALATGDAYGAAAKRAWPEKLEGIAAAELKGHPDPDISFLRKAMKAIVLGLNYGKTEMGIAFALLDDTGNPAEAGRVRDFLDAYHSAFPGVKLYQDHMFQVAQETGGVTSLRGRYRPIPDANDSREWVQNAGARQAYNTPIQGGAADVMNEATLACDRSEVLQRRKAKMVMQIHDELVVECPREHAEEVKAEVNTCMTSIEGLHVPLKVEASVVDNWDQAK